MVGGLKGLHGRARGVTAARVRAGRKRRMLEKCIAVIKGNSCRSVLLGLESGEKTRRVRAHESRYL